MFLVVIVPFSAMQATVFKQEVSFCEFLTLNLFFKELQVPKKTFKNKL